MKVVVRSWLEGYYAEVVKSVRYRLGCSLKTAVDLVQNHQPFEMSKESVAEWVKDMGQWMGVEVDDAPADASTFVQSTQPQPMRWTKQAPTAPGFYWARYAPEAHANESEVPVEVFDAAFSGPPQHLMVFVPSDESEAELSDFDRWSDRQIPKPEGPQPE
jgi:hypothetical protein